MVASNNKSNAGFYGTNEIVGSLGAVYLQNSGQAALKISVEKYGLVKSLPSWSAARPSCKGTRTARTAPPAAMPS